MAHTYHANNRHYAQSAAGGIAVASLEVRSPGSASCASHSQAVTRGVVNGVV